MPKDILSPQQVRELQTFSSENAARRKEEEGKIAANLEKRLQEELKLEAQKKAEEQLKLVIEYYYDKDISLIGDYNFGLIFKRNGENSEIMLPIWAADNQQTPNNSNRAITFTREPKKFNMPKIRSSYIDALTIDDKAELNATNNYQHIGEISDKGLGTLPPEIIARFLYETYLPREVMDSIILSNFPSVSIQNQMIVTAISAFINRKFFSLYDDPSLSRFGQPIDNELRHDHFTSVNYGLHAWVPRLSDVFSQVLTFKAVRDQSCYAAHLANAKPQEISMMDALWITFAHHQFKLKTTSGTNKNLIIRSKEKTELAASDIIEQQNKARNFFSSYLQDNYQNNIPFNNSKIYVFRKGSNLSLDHFLFYGGDDICGWRYDEAVNPMKDYTIHSKQAEITKKYLKEICQLTKRKAVFVCLGGGSLSEEIQQISTILEGNSTVEEVMIYSVELHSPMTTWKKEELEKIVKEKNPKIKKFDVKAIQKDFVECDLVSEIESGLSGKVRRAAYQISKRIHKLGEKMENCPLGLNLIGNSMKNFNLINFYKDTDYVYLAASNILGNLDEEQRIKLANNLRNDKEIFNARAIFGIPLEANTTTYESLEAKMALYRPIEILGIPYIEGNPKASAVKYVHEMPNKENKGNHQFFWEFSQNFPLYINNTLVYFEKGSRIQVKPNSGRFSLFGNENYQDAFELCNLMKNGLNQNGEIILATEKGIYIPGEDNLKLKEAEYLIASIM